MLQPNSLKQILTAMEVGDFHVFPVEEQPERTLRNYASELSYALNRVYKVHRNRAERSATISRTR